MSNTQKSTFRLFARPSFVEGYSRIIDTGRTLNMYNISETPERADYMAIKSDWQAVGIDIETSIKKYERGNKSRSDK